MKIRLAKIKYYDIVRHLDTCEAMKNVIPRHQTALEKSAAPLYKILVGNANMT